MKEVKVEYMNLDNRTIKDLEKESGELLKKILSDKNKQYKNDDFKKDNEFKAIIRRMNAINKVLEEKREIRDYGRILSDEERKKKWEKIEQEAVRMWELIAKQEQREAEMQQAYEDYITEEEQFKKMQEKLFPKKQITVKLFPNTHRKLKVMATSEDTTLEKAATSIVENEICNMDIVKYVTDEFKSAEELSFEGFDDYETAQYGYDKMQDDEKSLYDTISKELKNGTSRKRINVKVYYGTHRKLRVMAAIQDRSLDNIVSEIIENKIGEENEINTDELFNQLLEENDII